MVFEAFAGSAAPILPTAVNDLSGYRSVVEPHRLPIIRQSCASLARPSHTGGRINFFRGSGGRFFIKDGGIFCFVHGQSMDIAWTVHCFLSSAVEALPFGVGGALVCCLFLGRSDSGFLFL